MAVPVTATPPITDQRPGMPTTATRAVPSAPEVPVALDVRGLCAGYSGEDAIEDVTFRIRKGHRVALVGPNGAGKSTLFKAIVGLLPVRAGTVAIDGETGLSSRQQVAYVPQHGEIDWRFPVTVLDVTMMGLARQVGWLRLPGRHHRALAIAALERVGMADLYNRQIGELSGGQRRRVFIARAVAQGASVLLLDEPFAGVDTQAQGALFQTLDELRTDGVTVLLATHDLNTVSGRFDDLLVLNRRVFAYGPPHDVFRPGILSQAFGGQLAIWKEDDHTVLLADQCCP